MNEIKQQVRDFYNQVGWQEISQGTYQNAAYEDLRPVSREYIHRCHLRVGRHLKPDGRYLLDAGSGPIQYPEYLEYSKGYHYRICLDISNIALQEARKRIGEHGMYVVGDVANLPFKAGSFDGIVSLHTIHHLPVNDHVRAFEELYRTQAPGTQAVIVNGWQRPLLTSITDWLSDLAQKLTSKRTNQSTDKEPGGEAAPTGTFVRKHNAGWLIDEVGNHIPIKIMVWRSVNVKFLRTFVHARYAGRGILRFIFWLEERFPHFMGRFGQYPLILLTKKDK